MAETKEMQGEHPLPASDGEMIPQSFTIDPKHLLVLQRRAQERGVPLSSILREVLDEWIEKAEQSTQPPTTGKQLVELLQANGLIGMWADRTDIGDSVAFARRLRERAQTRADREDAVEIARRKGAHPAGKTTD
jgi:hypothetical protein